MKAVGIDIGSYSIKIAELEGSGNNIQIENLKDYPLSQKPGVDKELELVTNLKDILSQYDKEKTQFILGIPQDRVSTRNLYFPFKEKFKILKSLPFELEDLIPFSAFDAIFEGKIIKSLANGSEVLSVAVHKNVVKSYLELSSDVGIDPLILSLEGLALNNLFEDIFAPPPGGTLSSEQDEDSDLDDDEDVKKSNEIPEDTLLGDGEAILDIGHTSSMLVVRSKGALHNIRRINWGAVNLAKAISKKYNIQEIEALQNIKASKGVLLKDSASEQDLEFSNVLSEELASLGRILKLTLLEIKGANAVDVKGIGLMGGFAALPNLGPKLTELSLVPCNKILQIKNYPEIDIRANANNELSMGVAIGLALEAYRRPKNPAINFRKDEFSKENSSLKKLWTDWGFYINLAAASLAVFFIYSSLRFSISEDLSLQARKNMKDAAADIFKIKKYNASEQKLAKLFSALDKREATKEKIVETTQKLAAGPLTSLKKITEKASSRSQLPIDIKSLKINSNQIEIQGSTSAKTALQRFSNNLKILAKGKISKTERPNRGNGGVDFTITFKPKKGL